MWGVEAAKSLTDLQRTLSNAIKRLLGRIEALEQRPISSPAAPAADVAGVPIGTVLEWYSDTSLPIGCIRAEGQAVSRTEFSDLFALWGTQFGVGDGSTTFNVIDRQAIIARGIGSQVINGRTKTGPTLGEVREDQMQRITGGTKTNNTSIWMGGAQADIAASGQGAIAVSNSGNFNRANAGVNPFVGQIEFNSANSPDARTSSTTEGETRVNEIGAIFIIKAQNLETASATTSAVDSLNSRVSTTESDITNNLLRVAILERVDTNGGASTLIGAGDASTAVAGSNNLRRLNKITGINNNFVTLNTSTGAFTFTQTGVYEFEFTQFFERTATCSSYIGTAEFGSRINGTAEVVVSTTNGAVGSRQVVNSTAVTASLNSGDVRYLSNFIASKAGGNGCYGRIFTSAGQTSTFASVKITKIG